MRYISNKEMVPYLSSVLDRDGIHYYMKTVGEKQAVYTDLSQRQFKVVLEDARCEKSRMEHNPNIPVYSYRTVMDTQKLKRLVRINGTRGFRMEPKEKNKFYNAVGA